MGEAKRKRDLGLTPKKTNNKVIDNSPRLVNWLSVTQKQKDKFIQLSIKTSWVGIGFLVFLWLVVGFVGPYFGWWTPADSIS